MPEICSTCGLPKKVCDCEKIQPEQNVQVTSQKRPYNKSVTVIKGIERGRENLEKLASYLKKKLACGGTVKNERIELQGNHKNKIEDLLTKKGFSTSSIEIK